MSLLRKDCRGLESLPLKLIIVATVAALSILPAADALGTLRNRDFLQRADSQLDRIASAAETLAITGPGNVRTLSVDLTSEGSVRFSRLIIGGNASGPNASVLILELSTGARMVRALEDPPVCMTSPSGAAVEISNPVFEMRMTAAMDDFGTIIVEVG